MSAEHDATTAQTAPAEDAPEIVSAFPLPPAFFALYRDGVDSGPPPPVAMEPQYHMFGTPFSTKDVVPDLLPMPGQKLYLSGSEAAPGSNSGVGGGVAAESAGGGGSAGGAAGGADAADTKSSSSSSAESAGAGSDAVASIDYKTQMKKMNHSLLANFTELVDVLIKKPSLFNEKLADLELLFLNMHNLINTFRPHQARETIIHMLQMQIQERRDAAQEIRKTIDDSRRTVEEVHGQLHDHAFDRSQDAADIKMEDDDDSEDATLVGGQGGDGKGGATTAGGGGGAAGGAHTTGNTHGELSAKAHEAQQMQQSFFAALQIVASGAAAVAGAQ